MNNQSGKLFTKNMALTLYIKLQVKKKDHRDKRKKDYISFFSLTPI